MCNTAYNLKAVFSSLVFLNFGRSFAVTAYTHRAIPFNKHTPPVDGQFGYYGSLDTVYTG